MYGLFVTGLYVGGGESVKDGKVSYNYLLTDGQQNTWRIKCDENLLGSLTFGDVASFKVRVNAFNGNCYFSGTRATGARKTR